MSENAPAAAVPLHAAKSKATPAIATNVPTTARAVMRSPKAKYAMGIKKIGVVLVNVDEMPTLVNCSEISISVVPATGPATDASISQAKARGDDAISDRL